MNRLMFLVPVVLMYVFFFVADVIEILPFNDWWDFPNFMVLVVLWGISIIIGIIEGIK